MRLASIPAEYVGLYVCKKALGFMRDDRERLKSAIAYLDGHI